MKITTRDEEYWHIRELWLDDDPDEAACKLTVLDLPMRIGTTVVRMAGIGGVHTQWQHRMKGYMRALCEDSLEYMVDEGWTKKEAQKFVKEYARCPSARHWHNTVGLLPKELTPFHDTDSVPLIAGDNQVIFVVSGKYQSWVGLAMGTYIRETTFVTKKVNLPANWDKIVQKYRRRVPKYIMY